MTRLSMNSSDGQSSHLSKHQSKYLYGGITTVLVVGTALICYYRGKKTGEDSVSVKLTQAPQALNFVQLDNANQAPKLRSAMMHALALCEDTKCTGVGSTQRIDAIKFYSNDFNINDTTANKTNLTGYLTRLLQELQRMWMKQQLVA